jgi:hypothetical protein
MAASWRESGSSVTAGEDVDDSKEEEVEEVDRDPKASRFRRPWITANVWLDVDFLVVDVDRASRSEHWDGAFFCASGAGLKGAKPCV